MANGKITLGKQSGGTLGLVFPDGVSNTEVVLPESGELVTKEYVDTGAGASFVANDTRAKTALNATGNAPIYACRAWVNFNGRDTVAIRASGNVSSITDNGVGYYTVNFTTAMVGDDYAVSGILKYLDGSGYSGWVRLANNPTSLSNTGTMIYCVNGSSGDSSFDPQIVSLAIFR